MRTQFAAQIMKPLQTVIGFEETDIRFLSDPDCHELNALNRDGIVYLNIEKIRKSWDADQQVLKDIPKVLIFWYLTICHELAVSDLHVALWRTTFIPFAAQWRTSSQSQILKLLR